MFFLFINPSSHCPNVCCQLILVHSYGDEQSLQKQCYRRHPHNENFRNDDVQSISFSSLRWHVHVQWCLWIVDNFWVKKIASATKCKKAYFFLPGAGFISLNGTSVTNSPPRVPQLTLTRIEYEITIPMASDGDFPSPIKVDDAKLTSSSFKAPSKAMPVKQKSQGNRYLFPGKYYFGHFYPFDLCCWMQVELNRIA